MSQLAIGIIETIGLAAAIEAADVCVKSANVNLIGYELTKGSGMTVVKIEGNVGAVKAAIEAATAAASKVSKVYSKKVIPRPSDSIEYLIRNENTVGYKTDKKKEVVNKLEDIDGEVVSDDKVDTNDLDNSIDESNLNIDDLDIEETDVINDDVTEIDNESDEENEVEKDNEQEENIDEDDDSDKGYTCNLCKDPNCPRQKGDLRIDCIHYDEGKDN